MSNQRWILCIVISFVIPILARIIFDAPMAGVVGGCGGGLAAAAAVAALNRRKQARLLK